MSLPIWMSKYICIQRAEIDLPIETVNKFNCSLISFDWQIVARPPNKVTVFISLFEHLFHFNSYISHKKWEQLKVFVTIYVMLQLRGTFLSWDSSLEFNCPFVRCQSDVTALICQERENYIIEFILSVFCEKRNADRCFLRKIQSQSNANCN